MANTVKLELYRVFYVVARTGNLSKASKELFISQPAVSYAIKQLENQLGGRLFLRTAKGMELTAEGKMMYEYIARSYEEIIKAENRFSHMQGLEEGTVNIGASDTITKYFILPLLQDFNKLYNKISIKITNRTTDETIGLLKDGKVDMGFVNYSNGKTFAGVEFIPCSEVGECFVAKPQIMQSIKAPLSAQDLVKLPLIMLEEKSSTRRAVERTIENEGAKVVPAFELCSTDLIVDCVKTGLGIGCVTKEFVSKELSSGELVEVPLTFDLPKRNIAMVILEGMPPSFATAKLQTYFKKFSANAVKK